MQREDLLHPRSSRATQPQASRRTRHRGPKPRTRSGRRPVAALHRQGPCRTALWSSGWVELGTLLSVDEQDREDRSAHHGIRRARQPAARHEEDYSKASSPNCWAAAWRLDLVLDASLKPPPATGDVVRLRRPRLPCPAAEVRAQVKAKPDTNEPEKAAALTRILQRSAHPVRFDKVQGDPSDTLSRNRELRTENREPRTHNR